MWYNQIGGKMYKYLLIDLDGTLLDFKMGEKEAFIETLNKCGYKNISDEICNEFSKINEYYFNEYAKNNMTRDMFHYKRFNDIFKELDIKYDPMDADKIYVESLKYQAQLFPDILDTLDFLSKKYTLYIASNGINEIQEKRLLKANILSYFKEVFASEAIGFNKPKKEFFEYIIKKIGDTNLDSYLMIGDRFDTDILGAKNVCIKSILINRDNNLVNHEIEIKRFDELKKIL